MKTVIYYNVTTGEAFDQDGVLRTKNNPFVSSYRGRDTFEWHLISSYDPTLRISENTPWTDWDLTPQTASIAADDNYLDAYPATLKEAVPAGSGAVSIAVDSITGKIPPAGYLRFFRQDLSTLILPYTAVNESSDGFVFAVDIPETETEFPADSQVDILEEPLVYAPSMNSEKSVIEQSIFSFDLNLNGWRLAEKMEYSDIDSLPVKGLELCVSGTETDSGSMVVLINCQVPFSIKNVISLPFI